ncbi:MAG: PilZ domain-containing protein [Treponema sp.]|jgi:hypothetical protein|nr:PilZ domain-containing protein [Treponema sp.]
MAVITSQKIATYYERYKSIDVTYTKDIIQVTGMVTQQVFLKCGGDFWPCVVYSSSFEGAKIVANTKSGILNKLEVANNAASLRFCFSNQESSSPVTFFVAVRVGSNTPYGGDSKDMALFNLQFTQRPPDDLIEIMGRLLDANVNSVKRKNERINLTTETVRRLRILTKDIAAFIQGVPRRCILRDISFGGARLVIMGVAKFLVDKDSALRVDFDDPRASFLIKGKFIKAEPVEGRQDLLAVDIEFTEAHIPMGYKIRLNDFLGQTWADSRINEKSDKTAENSRAAKKAASTEKTEKEKAVDALKAMKNSGSNEEEGKAAPPVEKTLGSSSESEKAGA